MYDFDPYYVLLDIATNIVVLLMTAFVLQGHIFQSTLIYFHVFLCFLNSYNFSKL